MRINLFLFVFQVLCSSLLVNGQSDKGLFTEAESYLLYEEFNDALPLYLKLKKTYPQNHNLDYKIGRCYLFLPQGKEQAIRYLKTAAENISTDYKGKSLKETAAPPDAIFYLGRAYHINNELDLAVITYQKFLSLANNETYDDAFVNKQIEACRFAKEEMQKPSNVIFTNLGSTVNDRFSQLNAVVSGDGQTLVYTSKLQFYDAVFTSTKTTDGWSEPRNIIPELKVDDKIYPTALSYDGKELYLYKLDDYDGNIYVSELKNNAWTIPVKLNENINTHYWESHASVSKNGKTLYFTSNRPGGVGELDIYASTRTDGHNWQPAVNLGNTINSRQNDDTPFITMDGNTIYFSSLGHQSMGGYDILVTKKQANDQWGQPENLGYPVNTTSDEIFFQPMENGKFAYVSVLRKDGHGLHDVYEVDLLAKEEPIFISLKGKLNRSFDHSLQAQVVTTEDNKVIYQTSLSPGNELFETSIEPGNYKVIVTGKNIEPEEVEIRLHKDQENGVFDLTLNPTEIKERRLTSLFRKKDPEKKLVLEIKEGDITITDKGKVNLSLNASKNTNLAIKVENKGDDLVNESFFMEDDEFSYSFDALEGENSIAFTLTDGERTSISETLTITYQPEPKAAITGHHRIPNQLKLILNDLKEISTSPALVKAIDTLTKGTYELESVDDVYDKLKNLSSQFIYKQNDVDILMDRYLLSLIRYYETETMKNLLRERLNNELITTNDINNAYADINNLLYAITRLATQQSISKDDIFSYLKTSPSVNESIEAINIREAEGLFNWLKQVFSDERFFSSEGDAKATALALLEWMLIENHLDMLQETTSGSLHDFFMETDSILLPNFLEVKNGFIEGVTAGSITWNELIQSLLEVNSKLKNVATEDIEEVDATGENTEVSNVPSILLFIGGGLLLIFIILLFIRRRRKKTTK